MISLLIILSADLKERLRVLAHGADLRRFSTYDQVAAVSALPQGYAALLEYFFRLYIVQKLAVALLVRFFFFFNTAELLGQFVESLFIRLACHTVVHICPLVVFTLGGME